MIENLDKCWGIAASISLVVASLITTIITAVSDQDDDPTNDPTWQKVLKGIASILTRIFSFSTYSNRGAKKGFEAKLPLVQSASPKKKH